MQLGSPGSVTLGGLLDLPEPQDSSVKRAADAHLRALERSQCDSQGADPGQMPVLLVQDPRTNARGPGLTLDSYSVTIQDEVSLRSWVLSIIAV